MEKHIDDLLTICENDLKDPRSDKRAVRRTRAALEQAKYISRSHFPSDGSNRVAGPQNGSNVPPKAAGCNCVFKNGQLAGIDRDCPTHGSGVS